MKTDTYELLDSGEGKKWERFGPYVLQRPCPQAVWLSERKVQEDAFFVREKGNRWTFKIKMPASWQIELKGVTFKISPTDFGHLGVFPEHASLWDWMRPHVKKGMRVLNLFAYSGGATLAAAQEGAEVCHLDASKGMVDWARENARLNHLEKAPIRWIVDDAGKFLKREMKRGSLYDAIILDPPTFGRGAKGEVFKIEEEIVPLLQMCKAVLSKKPSFFVFSCHTPGFTPTVLKTLLEKTFAKKGESGEMLLESNTTCPIPSGSFARLLYA